MNSIVRVERAAYRYPQNSHGLAPISLVIRPGEPVFVTGPSGCGKSTLARCLTGLIPRLYRGWLAGEVWLDGLRTSDAPLWQLAERAGLVFQNPAAQMLGLSVEEEIVFGRAGTAVVVCEHRAEYLRQIPGLRTVHLDAPIPVDENGSRDRAASR